MVENKITEAGPLHTDDGRLANPGYAHSLILDYRRSRIKAPKWRIKEWDYYLVNDNEYAVAMTLGDLGYMGLISASVLDFAAGSYKTTSTLIPFPLGKFGMPESSAAGLSEYQNKRVHFRYDVAEGTRKLSVRFKGFDGTEDLAIDVCLDQEPRDSMVIATPWAENPLAFYYNQKIVGMRAQGSFTKGNLRHEFEPEYSFGLLDWGRGVWTYDNTWFWGVAQGWQDGEGGDAPGTHRFGLNIGYGFGDTSAASENMVFLDGVAYKLGRVDFGIPKAGAGVAAGGAPQARGDDAASAGAGLKAKGVGAAYDLMAQWHVTDDEGKMDLVFTPTIDRFDYTSVGVVVSDQHQVFGTFDGTVEIDGKPFKVAGLRGSAEVVHNKY